MSNAKNTSSKSAADKLVEEATEAGLVEAETTVPAQAERVESKRDSDGKLHILVTEETVDVEEKLAEALALAGLKEKLAEGTEAHIVIVDGEIKVDLVEPGKAKKFLAKAKNGLKKNKKAIIAGSVAALAIALGVSVKKAGAGSTEDEQDTEAETVEPTTED